VLNFEFRIQHSTFNIVHLINFTPITNVIGILLIIIGFLMFTALPFSWYYHSGDAKALFFSGGITILAGLLFWLYKYNANTDIKKREGYLIVALGWLSMVTFGSLPYLISGVIDEPVNAFFETVSGMTTTGATTLTDIEAVPAGILYWRSLTQWIGGMGIIVLTIAIFPLLRIGGVELFVAEAPGPTSDKLHPRIQETAKRLWLIYVSLTVLLMIILRLSGMNLYEAVNHALTTMATGGFSTRNDSIAAFDFPLIQYVLVDLHVCGGDQLYGHQLFAAGQMETGVAQRRAARLHRTGTDPCADRYDGRFLPH
jgi:trk system potassium uptake protein TrkH